MENENEIQELCEEFENQLRKLKAQSASTDLKSRLDQSLGQTKKHSILGIGFIAGITATIVIGLVTWWFVSQDPASPQVQLAEHQLSVGHQEILVEASEPIFRDLPGTGPMWQIDLTLLNRAFVNTPEGLTSSEFQVENRTVFVPVVYR